VNHAFEARNAVITELMSELDQLAVAEQSRRFTRGSRSCPTNLPTPMRGREESAALLPRRLIFGDPERSIVRISPDGTRIAFRAPVGGVLNLWVAPRGRPP
jgi:hypothetical protein